MGETKGSFIVFLIPYDKDQRKGGWDDIFRYPDGTIAYFKTENEAEDAIWTTARERRCGYQIVNLDSGEISKKYPTPPILF